MLFQRVRREYSAASVRRHCEEQGNNFDWMQPAASVDVKAPVKAPTDGINKRRMDPGQGSCKNSWVRGFTWMVFLDGPIVLAISLGLFFFLSTRVEFLWRLS